MAASANESFRLHSLKPAGKSTPKISMCLLGPSESGKSELVKCLIRGNPYRSMGVKGACFVHGLKLDYGQPILLHATECRGSRDEQLRDALAIKPDVYFLLYDVTEIRSFKEMRNKWLVSLYPKDVLTIIIGTKAEIPSSLEVNIPGVSSKAWDSGHLEISSITGHKVDYLIQRTAEIVIGLDVSNQTGSITESLAVCSISSVPSVAYYKMDTDPKGLCLVISIREFEDGNAYRYGTEKDETNLEQLFKSFGFKVEVTMNLKGSEITRKLKEMAGTDHSQYSCFICVVMSHGTSQSILASDGMKMDVDQLTKTFTGSRCESLRGKPKVFFIQACRGVEEHKSVIYETDSLQHDATAHIPDEADFLIARSTVDGFVSYRDHNKGSFYLSRLVDILKAHPKLSLTASLSILHKMIADIDFKTDSGPSRKQMPCYNTSLRKELVLG